MFIQPYNPHEISFAYCYRIYLRFRTHYNASYPVLAGLERIELEHLLSPYGVHLLELAADDTNVLVTLSLQPQETISVCANKVKGRVSKWLRESLRLENPETLLSKGYFACTVGANTSVAVDGYLSSQGAHHGYEQRAVPPIFVRSYDQDPDQIALISPKHAFVVAQFHLVLCTLGRRGVFGQEQGQRIADAWLALTMTVPFLLLKVSFVPEHVHIAVRLHPSLSPAQVVVELMNCAQELMQSELVEAGANRLWQSSAYVGSYGDLANAQIRKYLNNWAEENGDN